MWRKKQYKTFIKNKLEYFAKQTSFPQGTISDIIELIRFSPEEILKPYILTHSDLMQSIKWLILLHSLAMLKPRNNQTSIQTLLQLVNPQKQSPGTFQTILLEKMFVPYKAYLLKRNSCNLKEIQPEFHSFVLINLLKLALSFTMIVFTIGRYLLKSNSFLVDFNIAMARDLSCLYNTLNLKIDQNFIRSNLQVIENLNQNMYNVYYNCYFSKFVSKFAPEWIDTDIAISKGPKEMASTRFDCHTQFKTQKKLEIINTEIYHDHDVSFGMQVFTPNMKDHLKSTSTIATFRQAGGQDPEQNRKKQKQQSLQRKEFIFLAESILQDLKGTNNACYS